MRICFISNCLHLGGAERVLLETIDVLRERDIACGVIVPGEGELAAELARCGIPHAFVDGGSWIAWSPSSLFERVKILPRLGYALPGAVRIAKAWRSDLIYSNTLAVCNGAVIARLLKVPHIWHLHEFGREDHGVSYKLGERFSNRTIGRLANACIVVSNALASKYRCFISPSKLAVIYPSMHRATDWSRPLQPEPTQMVPRTANRVRLAIVGGLVEGKGQIDAVQALACLVRRGIDAELIIIGDGDKRYRQLLLESAEQNGLGNRVVFSGRVNNASPFIADADIVLVCSRSEAFGRATIEAMLQSKPVVAADSGATPELVRDHFNGLLYKSGDPADLAAKVAILIENLSLARSMGQNGKAWAAAYFTKERYSKELLGVLDSVCMQHGREAGKAMRH